MFRPSFTFNEKKCHYFPQSIPSMAKIRKEECARSFYKGNDSRNQNFHYDTNVNMDFPATIEKDSVSKNQSSYKRDSQGNLQFLSFQNGHLNPVSKNNSHFKETLV